MAWQALRAEAHEEPYPGEFSTDEAKALIDDFRKAGDPILIFTGGEPMMRKDWPELVRYATSLGLRCVMSPNGTLITAESARTMVEAGVQRVSISIDGPDAASHDAFRGVPGAFAASMRGIEYLKAAGLEFQINTTVTRGNLEMFKDIFKLCESLGAAAWHIFLLVPTGRAPSSAPRSSAPPNTRTCSTGSTTSRKPRPCSSRPPAPRTTTASCGSAPRPRASP
jgi:MoaA/NifB/PqqE/SkfB family radical SAM enzyme